MAGPSQAQLFAISVTERTCSTISLIGTFVIVATFIGSRSFRKPINRLVFYASWGNIMANIATLISQDGIHAGFGSSLCQFQAFLIQWFMPADALWTFAMACNVYLTFFRKYDSEQLRQLEWKYLICCYGVPFIPALTYFFVKTEALGRVYGSAILWCWVSKQWDWLRIATFYGPVWLVIMLTFAIYIRAGSVIYQKRRQFRNFGNTDSLDLDSDTHPVFPLSKLAGIQVTSEIAYSVPEPERSSSSFLYCDGQGQKQGQGQGQAGGQRQGQDNGHDHDHHGQGTSTKDRDHHGYTSNFGPAYSVTIQGGGPSNFAREFLPDPSSSSAIPRILSLRVVDPNSRPDLIPRQSGLGGGGEGGGRGNISHLHLERVEAYSRRRSTTGENSSAAWAYTKYAMLFFIALLVTWVPSTVNRVYALARPDDFSFGLNFASSFVLPLQGFWNSLIYISISWPAFKIIWRSFRQKWSSSRSSMVPVEESWT